MFFFLFLLVCWDLLSALYSFSPSNRPSLLKSFAVFQVLSTVPSFGEENRFDSKRAFGMKRSGYLNQDPLVRSFFPGKASSLPRFKLFFSHRDIHLEGHLPEQPAFRSANLGGKSAILAQQGGYESKSSYPVEHPA